MAEALARRDNAGPQERDMYASYINECLSEGVGTTLRTRSSSSSALPLSRCPSRRAAGLSQRTIGQVAEMISRYPKIRFQCHLASRHANQSLCTMCRELPNFSLCGYLVA